LRPKTVLIVISSHSPPLVRSGGSAAGKVKNMSGRVFLDRFDSISSPFRRYLVAVIEHLSACWTPPRLTTMKRRSPTVMAA